MFKTINIEIIKVEEDSTSKITETSIEIIGVALTITNILNIIILTGQDLGISKRTFLDQEVKIKYSSNNRKYIQDLIRLNNNNNNHHHKLNRNLIKRKELIITNRI